jgi:hypothetical protein
VKCVFDKCVLIFDSMEQFCSMLFYFFSVNLCVLCVSVVKKASIFLMLLSKRRLYHRDTEDTEDTEVHRENQNSFVLLASLIEFRLL